jgi:hypothetical protein
MLGVVCAGAAVDTAFGRWLNVPDAIHTLAFIVEEILPAIQLLKYGDTNAVGEVDVTDAGFKHSDSKKKKQPAAVVGWSQGGAAKSEIDALLCVLLRWRHHGTARLASPCG